MPELMDIIKARRSTRAFVPGKLPPRAQVEQLVEAGRQAAWVSNYGTLLCFIMQKKALPLQKLLQKRVTVGQIIIFTMRRCKLSFLISGMKSMLIWMLPPLWKICC